MSALGSLLTAPKPALSPPSLTSQPTLPLPTATGAKPPTLPPVSLPPHNQQPLSPTLGTPVTGGASDRPRFMIGEESESPKPKPAPPGATVCEYMLAALWWQIIVHLSVVTRRPLVEL